MKHDVDYTHCTTHYSKEYRYNYDYSPERHTIFNANKFKTDTSNRLRVLKALFINSCTFKHMVGFSLVTPLLWKANIELIGRVVNALSIDIVLHKVTKSKYIKLIKVLPISD